MKIGFRAVNMGELWEYKQYLPYYSIPQKGKMVLLCPVTHKYVSIERVLTESGWNIDHILMVDFKGDFMSENDIVEIEGKLYELSFNERELRVEGKDEQGEIIFGSILNKGIVVDNVYLRRLRAVEWTQKKM